MAQLASEGRKYDLIFVDAHKLEYKQYIEVSTEYC
jgi:predicted O-methyltransferase YrrM